MLNEYIKEGWSNIEEFDINNCPIIFLKRDSDKLILILATMDNKTYLYSQLYLKEENKDKEKQNLIENSQVSINLGDILDHLYALYVFYFNGTTIFEYQFKEQKIDSDLFTSILSAISDVLKEATGNLSNIKEISQENLYIIFEHEKLFSTILLCDINIPNIRIILKEFNNTFLRNFNEYLKNWTGEVSKFKNTINIINDIFKVDKLKDKLNKINTATDKTNNLEQTNYINSPKNSENNNITEKTFYYYCESCKQWYKVNFEGVYSCLYCGNILINKTDFVLKYKQ
ncbi:MAG: hypothetical protein ACTSQO_01245 [Candidatus Helarchaeota archaeon]